MVPTAMQAAENCRVGSHLYAVTQAGDKAGLLHVQVRDEGEFCSLESKEWMQNKFLGLTQYCHFTHRQERWRGRVLVNYSADTHGWCSGLAATARPSACKWREDGAPLQVRGDVSASTLRLNGLEFVADSKQPFVTRNYLAPFFPGPNAFQVIDPIQGRLKAATAIRSTASGDQTTSDGATRYIVTGAGDRTLDYNRSGALVQMRLTGDDVVSQLVPADTQHAELLPEPGNEACMAILARP